MNNEIPKVARAIASNSLSNVLIYYHFARKNCELKYD